MKNEKFVKLTKRVVDAALPKDKKFRIPDTELKGFALKIEPTGTKTFIVDYRIKGGGRCEIKNMGMQLTGLRLFYLLYVDFTV